MGSRDGPVTATTRKVVLAVAHLEGKLGYPPTLQEIGDRVGLEIHAVWRQVQIARREGYILDSTRERFCHRTIQVSQIGLVWVGLEKCPHCGHTRRPRTGD